MRDVQGFVHIIGDMIYGKGGWFGGTGLLPFSAFKEAKIDSYRRRPGQTEVFKIQLEIAETEADIATFRFKRRFVVIQTSDAPSDPVCQIFGPRVKDCPHFFDGAALFSMNGHRPFRTCAGAEYAAREIARQSACPVQLAHLTFRRATLPRPVIL